MVNLEIWGGKYFILSNKLKTRNSEHSMSLIRKITFIWTIKFKTVLHGYRVFSCIVRYHPGILNFRH